MGRQDTPRHNQYRQLRSSGPFIHRPDTVVHRTIVQPVGVASHVLPPPAGRPAGPARSGVSSVDIAELKQKSVAELHTLAEQLNISNYSGLRKQDLIFRIEQSLLDSDTVIRGEGVLEILPEGYGFLRSQDWNYLVRPRRHLRLAQPDQAVRPAHRRHRHGPGPAAQGGRALPGPAQGRAGQLRGAGEDQAPDRVRQPAAALSRRADPARAEERRLSACGWWTCSRPSARASAG